MSGFLPNTHNAGRTGRSAIAFRPPVPALATALLMGAILAMSLALLAPSPASAQLTDTESIVNRLIRLEREIQTLNLQVYRGAPAPAGESVAPAAIPEGYAAQFEVRLAQIERQLRESTGLLEQSQFRVRQLTDRLDRALTDMEYRLTLLEGGQPPAPSASTDSGALSTTDSPKATQAPAQLAVAPATELAAPPGTLGAVDLTAPPVTAAAPAVEAAAVTAAAVALPVGSADTQYDFAYGLLARATMTGPNRRCRSSPRPIRKIR